MAVKQGAVMDLEMAGTENYLRFSDSDIDAAVILVDLSGLLKTHQTS